MELSEVINPHYAFPVVGVLLCALLVFAFGFKSPAQPPSFDFEDDRKTSGSKKRKHVKKPLSSGTSVMPDSLPKGNTEKVTRQTSEKQAVPIKAKQNSATLGEKHSLNKPQIKNKKNEKNERNAQKKKEENLSQDKQIPKKEEAGEWVQLLTRKEKKNRKRDELYGVGDDDDERNEGSKGGTPEKKQPAIVGAMDSQENSPSKKKKKKTNKESVEKKETKSEQKVKVENAKNEILIKVKLDPEDNYDDVSEKNIVINLKETSQVQEKGEELNMVLLTESIRSEQVKVQDSTDETPQKSIVEANVGGVAFDELKDVWEEPKTQKKKKKVRRDQ